MTMYMTEILNEPSFLRARRNLILSAFWVVFLVSTGTKIKTGTLQGIVTLDFGNIKRVYIWMLVSLGYFFWRYFCACRFHLSRYWEIEAKNERDKRIIKILGWFSAKMFKQYCDDNAGDAGVERIKKHYEQGRVTVSLKEFRCSWLKASVDLCLVDRGLSAKCGGTSHRPVSTRHLLIARFIGFLNYLVSDIRFSEIYWPGLCGIGALFYGVVVWFCLG